MAQNKNTLAIGLNLIQLAPAIVNLFRLFRQDHTGADTKAAAIEAGKMVLSAAGQLALANNPAFSENYGAVIQAAFDASQPIAINLPPQP